MSVQSQQSQNSKKSLQFTVIDAFTTKPFCGNPAAIIVLPADHKYPDSVLHGIAIEFNLSETAYITPTSTNPAPLSNSSSPDKYVSFGLRWFTPGGEYPICGHATLASSARLFSDTSLVPERVNEIHFSTLSGILKAIRLPPSGSDAELGKDLKIQLEFPAGNIIQADSAFKLSVEEAMSNATGLPANEIGISFVGISEQDPYTKYLLIEISPKVDLKKLKVNSAVLGGGIPTHLVNVVTNQTLDSAGNPTTGFNIRTFAWNESVAEDPVCGSASTFASVYWTTRTQSVDSNVQPGDEIRISHVSPRGGEMGVAWNKNNGTAFLRGYTRVASRGEIYL